MWKNPQSSSQLTGTIGIEGSIPNETTACTAGGFTYLNLPEMCPAELRLPPLDSYTNNDYKVHTMIQTFAELQQTQRVDPQDVLDTLRDYAKSGSGIRGSVVTQILGRTQLSHDQLQDVLAAAETGVQTHMGMSDKVGFTEGVAKQDAEMDEAGEYQRVANFVQGLLRQVEQK